MPVGVEAYGAYALGAWLTPGTSERARRFARISAIGSLALGGLGQVAFHLLTAEHATRAPWPVTMLVSCLPVVALAFGAALAHLLREPGEGTLVTVTIPTDASTVEAVSDIVPSDVLDPVTDDVPETEPVTVSESEPESEPETVSARVRSSRAPRRAPASRSKSPERVFAADIERGELPSLRVVKTQLHVGTDRARVIRDQLAVMLRERVPEAA